VVSRRGRWKAACARGACPALLGGPSTSSLGVMRQHVTQRSDLVVAAARLRRVLIWSHVVVGAVTLFIYLSTLDLRPGTALLLIGAPVLLPYVISAVHCSRLYTWQGSGPSRLRVAGFLALLIAAAVVVDAVLLGAFGHVERIYLFELLGVQGWAYLWGASWILDVI
jgi:hypothetical protein